MSLTYQSVSVTLTAWGLPTVWRHQGRVHSWAGRQENEEKKMRMKWMTFLTAIIRLYNSQKTYFCSRSEVDDSTCVWKEEISQGGLEYNKGNWIICYGWEKGTHKCLLICERKPQQRTSMLWELAGYFLITLNAASVSGSKICRLTNETSLHS